MKSLSRVGAIFLALFTSAALTGCRDTGPYEFIVAGHTYGAHKGDNLGLYPKFLQKVEEVLNEKTAFIVLTGDIVRESDEFAWQTAISQLETFRRPYFFVMGNHDVSPYATALFDKKFKNTYYKYKRQSELFIVLDTHKTVRNIDTAQLEFLNKSLATAKEVKNVFIFVHELIWAIDPAFSGIAHNYGSYDEVLKPDVWKNVYSILEDYPQYNIYLIAGDVGGNPGTIPAYYKRLGHITLIASGMGEIQDENFLIVGVNEGRVDFKLVPLNIKNGLPPLDTDDTPASN